MIAMIRMGGGLPAWFSDSYLFLIAKICYVLKEIASLTVLLSSLESLQGVPKLFELLLNVKK